MHSGVSSYPLLLARTPPSSILYLLRYRHHWGLSWVSLYGSARPWTKAPDLN